MNFRESWMHFALSGRGLLLAVVCFSIKEKDICEKLTYLVTQPN